MKRPTREEFIAIYKSLTEEQRRRLEKLVNKLTQEIPHHGLAAQNEEAKS